MNKVITLKANKEKFLKILKSEESGGSISLASKKCVLSRQTIYNWRKTDPEFDLNVHEAAIEGKDTIADIAEQGLIERIRAKDTTAIIFTLKSLRREYYAPYQEMEMLKKTAEVETKKDSLEPKTPNEAVLVAIMFNGYYKDLLEKHKVITPEVSNLFLKLEDELRKLERIT